jgi:SAM-dependent methyltransferase
MSERNPSTVTAPSANSQHTASGPPAADRREVLVCQVCMTAAKHQKFTAREMMFGTRDRFEYFECSECGCVQIETPPDDIGKYYPPNYYSLAQPAPPRKFTPRERFVTRRISSYLLTGKGRLGALLHKRHPGAADVPTWLKPSELRLGVRSRILDVGCGRGELLLQLRELGFTRLLGADAYIDSDISYDRGLKIRKAQLSDLKGRFDLIMLHHSFEHMPEPRATMNHLFRLTRRGRYVIVRVPVAGSYAWRKYGTDWVGLDAPRHFFLHTPRSLGLLAEQAGFQLTTVIYDSAGSQFAASEQYRAGIPLTDPRSFTVNPPGKLFSEERLREFEAQAAALNATGDGDQACFYLYKP